MVLFWCFCQRETLPSGAFPDSALFRRSLIALIKPSKQWASVQFSLVRQGLFTGPSEILRKMTYPSFQMNPFTLDSSDVSIFQGSSWETLSNILATESPFEQKPSEDGDCLKITPKEPCNLKTDNKAWMTETQKV